jgi:tripartite-type tricarboxylate transporter receptor subunit TctC
MHSLGVATVLLALAGTAADAQTFPNRPIRLVVPYAPGGALDYSGRLLAKTLSDSVGQQVVVDNRPGAGGVIGTEGVVRSPPDGYTLLLMDSAIVVTPSLQKSVPYDVIKDLQPISMVSSSALVVVVPIASPAQDVPSLIGYAKTRPGGLNFGSAGIGTAPHMAGELFKLSTGAPLTHVAYKGMGPAVADLVAGQIELGFGSITAALPFITDGKLRGLATTAAKRSAALPNLPTVAEAGVAGFEVDLWLALFGPPNMPPPLLAQLNQMARNALAAPSLVEGFARVGAEPLATAPDESARFIAAELAKWSRVVAGANLQAN